MTVNVFQIGLLLLIGFMAILGGFLLPEEVKKAESLFQKIAFCLLIAFCAGIGAIAGGIITSPVNDTTYWVLGVGYPVALPTTWILLQRQQEAERENLQRKLRQVLLTRVTEEVNQRWKFSLHEQKLIQVSSKLYDHLAPLPAPAPPVEPPPSPLEIFKPVVDLFQPVVDVLRVVYIFKPDTQEPEIIPLELNQPIIEIFNRDEIGRKLLIFGEPGSGKTTELLNLAIALCKNAANSEQVAVPVIFELSAWKGQPIAQWLAEELKIRYEIDESLTLKWLQQDKIIPLLDGLDELKELKDQGIEAINEFYQESRPRHLVICSRLKDYRECQNRLAPKGAICLQPLNDKQIQDYLEKRHCLQLWQPIKNDPDGLLELARSPLLLNLIPAAYQHGFVGKGKRCQTEEEKASYQKECRGDLFDAYIEHQLASKVDNRGYSKAQTKHWLTWLAQRLREERRTDFYIEKMQPSWLETPEQRQKYQLAVRLIVGLSLGLIVGLIFGLILGLIGGLIFGLIGGLIFGLDEIELTEAISLSPAKIKNGLILGLILGLIFGLILGLILGLIYGLILGLIYGLIFGLILGLIYGLIEGLKADIKVREYPNQGIRESAKKALIISLFSYPAGVLCFVLPNLILGNPAVIIDSLIPGMAIALFSGIYLGGGLACIQHFVLRRVLYQSGAIPWNYADFLDYADKLDLIDQVGGRYRFYHDLLREHFAGEQPLAPRLAQPTQKSPVGLFFVAFLLLLFYFNITTINSSPLGGMAPALQGNETILVDKVTYRFRVISRGDIVQFNPNQSLKKQGFTDNYFRRIIGLPGETVEVKEGKVYINQQPLQEPYIKVPPTYQYAAVQIPAHTYFVLGNNPEYKEYKLFGALVPKENIQGQAIFILWPPHRFGKID